MCSSDLFFLFLSPASLLSSFFLLIFFSLPHLLFALPIYSGSSSSLPICSGFIFIADLHLHRRPTSLSHVVDPFRPVLHLTTDLSSIADLSFIIDPSSTSIAFIELKSAADFVVGFHGCGWISWVSLGFVMAVWLGFMVAKFRGLVVVWLC